jgi:hypothetical protein
LSEFRNELKFLCIYCLKKSKTKTDLNEKKMKAKEMFLEKVEKIDFRERIEFENKEKLEFESEEENELNLSSEEENEDLIEDNDDEWVTTSETSDDSEDNSLDNENTNNQIVSYFSIRFFLFFSLNFF